MFLVDEAREFAATKHAWQVRKYTGAPYIIHPFQVMLMVKSVEHTEEMLAAAWLHDVVEDCGVELDEIQDRFGNTVAQYVDELTDKPSPANRAERKRQQRIALAMASPEAKTIKIADLIDNTSDIAQHDRDFARVYLREKRLLLDESLVGGNPLLWARADAQIRAWGGR